MPVTADHLVSICNPNGSSYGEALPTVAELVAVVSDEIDPVTEDDPRLSDQRPPAVHTHPWTEVTAKPVTFPPDAHSHDWASVTGKPSTFAPVIGGAGTEAVAGNDSRLTNDRKPAFVAGDGGTVTQATNKATAVTLNKRAGDITTTAAALAAGAIVTFTLNNSTVVLTDQIIATHHSGGTAGPYLLTARATGVGTATISIRNTSAGSLSEAIVIRFSVLKSVNA